MLDSIRHPKKSAVSPPRSSAPAQERDGGNESRGQFQPKRLSEETKVWVSILATSMVIIGVWIFTFRLPQVEKPPKNQDVSELKSSLETMLEDLKEGWGTIQSQKSVLSQPLTNEQITKIVQEIQGAATSSTSTISTLPQNAPTTK